MNNEFTEEIKNIQSNRPLISVQDIVTFIEKGERYLRMSLESNNEINEIDFLQGIVLSPDYQRSYRSSVKEESSIIESLLIGIPIPEVFLVITAQNDAQIRHVMDGQHRLNAIYRYVNDKFPLKNLEILKDNSLYSNRKFSELEKKDKIKILGSHLSVLEFKSFNNPEIEIELFKRYNRNTKPLEAQEIEMATYFSETSKYITNFINVLIENEHEAEKIDISYESKERKKLIKIYNITQTRNNKQKNHQEICIIFSILEYGLQVDIRDGVTASKKFLEKKSKLYKENSSESLNLSIENFIKFNTFLLKITDTIEYPFSTTMLDEDKDKQSKYLMGVSIVIAAIYYYFEIDINSVSLIDELKGILKTSPMADLEYKASSTNMKNIINYLFLKNKIHEKEFESFKLIEKRRIEIEAWT